MTQWLKYFLVGIERTATEAVQTLSQVIKLKASLEAEMSTTFGRKAHSAITLLNQLFVKPIVHVNDVKEITGLSKKAANDLAADFEREAILVEMTGQSRNRLFVFDQYLALFQKE